MNIKNVEKKVKVNFISSYRSLFFKVLVLINYNNLDPHITNCKLISAILFMTLMAQKLHTSPLRICAVLF